MFMLQAFCCECTKLSSERIIACMNPDSKMQCPLFQVLVAGRWCNTELDTSCGGLAFKAQALLQVIGQIYFLQGIHTCIVHCLASKVIHVFHPF